MEALSMLVPVLFALIGALSAFAFIIGLRG